MMQTMYYTTHNFVRRSGNVIDLCEYRSRMQDVQEEPVSAAPAARTERTRRRHPHQNAFALLMDSFASMSVILMTLTFTCEVAPVGETCYNDGSRRAPPPRRKSDRSRGA